MYCACGHACDARDRYCAVCGRHLPQHVPPATAVSATATVSDEIMLARIADYERVSAILWMILGIVQVLLIVTIIAGVWNIFAASTRFKMSPLIRARDPGVPAAYEGGLVQLVILGALNFFLGAAVGVIFVIFDFYIRDLVLKHRHLFNGGVVAAPAPQPPPVPGSAS